MYYCVLRVDPEIDELPKEEEVKPPAPPAKKVEEKPKPVAPKKEEKPKPVEKPKPEPVKEPEKPVEQPPAASPYYSFYDILSYSPYLLHYY